MLGALVVLLAAQGGGGPHPARPLSNEARVSTTRLAGATAPLAPHPSGTDGGIWSDPAAGATAQLATDPREFGGHDGGRAPAATPEFGTSSGAVPPDPFADEYLPPVAREVGSSQGQLRISAALGLVGLSPEGFVSGTVESMPGQHLGVRISASAAFTRRTSTPHLLTAGLGASLHVLPYHRVDLSFAFEGGLAVVNVTDATRTLMPLITGRTQLDVWVSSWVFLQLAGQVSAGIFAAGPAARLYLEPGLFFSGGYAL